MTLAYTTHILEERFGDAWWQSGALDLKFTNPTWPNDDITARGVDTGPVDGDSSGNGGGPPRRVRLVGEGGRHGGADRPSERSPRRGDPCGRPDSRRAGVGRIATHRRRIRDGTSPSPTVASRPPRLRTPFARTNVSLLVETETVTYGRADGLDLLAEHYRASQPADRSGKAVVMVHGGAWTSNGPTLSRRPLPGPGVERGSRCFSLDFRDGRNGKHPCAVQGHHRGCSVRPR